MKIIVGGLSVIDVIVGMDALVLAEPTAKNLLRPIRDHLVRIHVKANAGSGLKYVHNKFAIPLTVNHFLCGGDDGVGYLGIHKTEFLVSFGGGAFNHGDGAN